MRKVAKERTRMNSLKEAAEHEEGTRMNSPKEAAEQWGGEKYGENFLKPK